jgi:hypothetical protein
LSISWQQLPKICSLEKIHPVAPKHQGTTVEESTLQKLNQGE